MRFSASFSMAQREFKTELVRDGGDAANHGVPASAVISKSGERVKQLPFSTTSIRTDDDSILPPSNVLLDVRNDERLRVKVVDGEIEKPLDLASVQVHGDHMVAASDGEHVGDKLGGDGGAALVLFVHACVRITWNNGGDAAGRGALARGNEDEEFHEVIIDVATGGL